MLHAFSKIALGFAVLAAPIQAIAAEHYRLDAPDELAPLLREFLPAESDAGTEDDPAARLGLIRRLREKATELLATEGYFSPQIIVSSDDAIPLLRISPGRRTQIASVNIEFSGSLETDPDLEQRREQLRKDWGLAVGEPFRQQAWSQAKDRLLQAASSRDFATARYSETVADVDPESATVHLRVVLESGPRFRIGSILVEGLDTYDRALVDRYTILRPGEAYSVERLLAQQSLLQNTPYFSAVEITLDQEGADPAKVPVRIRVVEAKPKRLGFGLGFSSNTGARVETSYRDADFFGRAWQLMSGVRVEQLRRAAFADVFFPPDADGARNSVGVIVEHSNIKGLTTDRQSLGVARSRTRGDIDTRIGLSLQREVRRVEDEAPDRRQALALNWAWTRRKVDNPLDPREGHSLSVQLGGATRALLSDANFLRTSGRLSVWTSLSPNLVLGLRAEGGYTAARSRNDVPEEFLFRTGGAQSVRGYPYLGIGVQEHGAVVGGRYMAAGSAELTRWFSGNWGVAGFIDAGNASDHLDEGFSRPKIGIGAGVRWRSPAGPIAFDLAYGRDDKRIRPHISIAIAF